MNNCLLNNKELISVYMSILGTVFTIIGGIAIPVILWCWSSKDQKRKEKKEQDRIERDKKEEIRKEEKSFIVSFIKEYVYPLGDELNNICWQFGTEIKRLQSDLENTNENSDKEIISKNIEITDNNHKLVLKTILQKCERISINLINLVRYFKYYNYIVQYLDILLIINYKIRDNIDNISKSELIMSIIITISNIRLVASFIELNKEIYEMTIAGYFHSYCKHCFILKTIILEVLKDYPKYYEAVQNYIKEEENKMERYKN